MLQIPDLFKKIGKAIAYIFIIIGFLQSSVWVYEFFDQGDFHIDFKENKIKTVDGKNYSVIEVFNEYRPLNNVEGNVFLKCTDLGGVYKSQKYELQEDREFLCEGCRSEFLLSQDELFVNLAHNYASNCSDAIMFIAHYTKKNDTHMLRDLLYKFDYYDIKNGSIKIMFSNLSLNTSSIYNSECLKCAILVNISASGFSKTHFELHNFSSPSDVFKYPLILKNPSKTLLSMHVVNAPDFTPCKGINSDACTDLVCKKTMTIYGSDFSCQGDGWNASYSGNFLYKHLYQDTFEAGQFIDAN